MRGRYVWRDGAFVEKKTGEPLNGNTPDRIASPMLMRDVAYISPLSRKPITSRSERRNEMAEHNVREVDPGEFKPVYRTRKWAERMKGEHDPKAGLPAYADEAPFKRLAKNELPARIAKTIER